MKILICSDGSTQAESNVHLGGFIASRCQAQEVLLVGVSEASEGEPCALAESLERSRAWLQEDGVEASVLVQAGDPVESLAALTLDKHFDLVIVGGVRRQGEGPLALPAKAYALLRRLDARVLLVSGFREEIRKILFCTGGGFKAERAVRFTGRIAQGTGASVTVFHVMAEPYSVFSEMGNEEDVDYLLQSNSALARALRRQRDILQEMNVTAAMRVRYGLVFEEILAEIEEGDYDLVVSGSHPVAGPIREYMMGDMTRQLVEHVDRPILIVRTVDPPVGILQELRRVFSGWRQRSTTEG